MSAKQKLSNQILNKIRDEAMNLAGIGLLRYTVEGKIIHLDDAIFNIFDLSDIFPNVESLLNTDIGELFIFTTPKDYLLDIIKSEGCIKGLEYQFRTLKGQTRYAMIDGYISFDEDLSSEVIQLLIRDITALSFENTERKRNLEFETLISDMHSKFIDIMDIDYSISETLGKIGTVAHAGRASLYTVRDNETMFDLTHEWCDKGVPAKIDQLQNQQTSKFGWWFKTLKEKGVVIINDTSKLMFDAEIEKQSLNFHRIKSVLSMPISLNDQLKGFISLDIVNEPREWTNDDISLLRIFANTLSIVIQRKELIEELHRFKLIADKAQYASIICDMNGKMLYVNQSASELHGHKIEEMTGKHLSFLHTTHEQEEVDSLIAEVKKHGKISTKVFCHTHQGTKCIPTLTLADIIRDDHGKDLYIALKTTPISKEDLTTHQERKCINN